MLSITRKKNMLIINMSSLTEEGNQIASVLVLYKNYKHNGQVLIPLYGCV